jgi:hypothetical protein
MTRDLHRRLGHLESQQGAAIPAEIRQWLGEPITDAERAHIAATPLPIAVEQCTIIARMPATLRAWFAERA